MRRFIRVLPALILLTLYSCGDSAIFLEPVEETAQVRVESIRAGSIVQPGSEVPIGIARDPVFTGDPETADQLVVELLDSDDVLLGEQLYESVDQADELPPLLLPEIGEGYFVLRTSYYDGDELIETADTPFFVTSGIYSIVGLSSYPATLYPDSAGLLSVNLDIPAGSDPYLEWYLDEETLLAGYLSETGNTVEVRAPGEPGASTVRVDLYPVAPPSTVDEVPAVVTFQTELLVSRDLVIDQPSFMPERSYYTLLHFLGDLRDSGARQSLFSEEASLDALSPARPVGDPTLALEGDAFGYAVDGDDGFDLDGFVLPVRDGRLSPFSVSLRVRPSVLTDGASLFEATYGNETVLALEADEEGRLSLSLEPGGREISTSEQVLVSEQTSVVTITILPLESSAAVQFYVDGDIVQTELVDWTHSQLGFDDVIEQTDEGWMMLPGSARIAGPGGFIGIIDEFGVYFRDSGDEPSPDTGVFLSAMENIHGDKLVYAEGFEARDVPQEIAVNGDARIETGRLVLGTGASAFFPLFAFSSEELVVTVALDALPGSEISFYLGDSDELISRFVPVREDADSADLDFVFFHRDRTLLISGPFGSEESLEIDPEHDFRGLRLEVGQTGGLPAEIAVQSVVAWREFPEIPESLLEPETGSEPEPETQSGAGAEPGSETTGGQDPAAAE